MVTMDLVFDNANDVQCIRIQIVDDDVIERPETFIVSLTENDPNVDLVEPTTSTLTIIDNSMCSSMSELAGIFITAFSVCIQS